MPTTAIIGQGVGKATLALYLAVTAQDAGAVSLIIDTDPQATARQWTALRQNAPPEVIDSPSLRLAIEIPQARRQGVELIVIDTQSLCRQRGDRSGGPPCRSSAFDLAAIQTSVKLVQRLRKPAFVLFTAGAPYASRIYRRRASW